jgi:hypothetical protein
LITVVLLLSLVLVVPAGCAKQQHIEGFEDIPLYHKAKLKQLNLKSRIGWGKASKLHSLIVYVTSDSKEKTMQFYKENMPKNGWKLTSKSGNDLFFDKGRRHVEIRFGASGEKGYDYMINIQVFEPFKR